MGQAAIVAAVRTPFGKRGGSLAQVHPAVLLGDLLRSLVESVDLHPAEVGQVIGGCSTQSGEQGFNVARMAWLAADLPVAVGASTVDCQCGSSLQANQLAAALISAGVVSVAIACGVESMSRVPMGSSIAGARVKPPGMVHCLPNQFVAAERVAQKYGVTRQDADALGLSSQIRARAALDRGWFQSEVVGRAELSRDEVIRHTDAKRLAKLPPLRPNGVHTAGSVSAIADGAAAVLWMDVDRARASGIRPRARALGQVLVGSNPELHIDGPLVATEAVLRQCGMASSDVDLFEVNEAFASVVLAWQRTFGVDADRLNPNGGAIALGHPLGATGARLVVGALHELERTGRATALLTLCCGSAVAPALVLERLD